LARPGFIGTSPLAILDSRVPPRGFALIAVR